MDTMVSIPHKVEDLVSWLHELKPETVVHNYGPGVSENCTVARFLQDMLGDPTLYVTYTRVYGDDEQRVYQLNQNLAKLVILLDIHASEQPSLTLTASGVLEYLGEE